MRNQVSFIRQLFSFLFVGLCSLMSNTAFAQNGGAGLEQANTMVRGYFVQGTTLLYGVGAVLALIGAGKAYQKWNMGEPNVWSHVSAWFGSCIFLVVVASAIKSFFGV